MNTCHDIVTITLNPAIDLTVFLDRLHVGHVNRTRRHHRQPGGKGINVSSMLGQYGIPNIATGFLGKDNAQCFDELFRCQPIHDEFVRIPGETRTGIKIVDEGSGETTDINFPGLEPTADEVSAFEKRLHSLVKPGRWFVLAGSLPAGFGSGFIGKIVTLIQAGGAFVAVDTSGDALKTAIQCGADLVKPNHHELAEFLGHELPDLATCVAAARELQCGKVSHVILSLGGRGALFITPEAALMASAPPVKVMSTVGAGDSLLAGFLAGLVTDQPPAGCARLATVFAWAALEDVTHQLPDADEIRKRLASIHIQPL
jgi:1-phosphofructokinase